MRFGWSVLAVLGVVVVFDHPFFVIGYRFFYLLSVVGRVDEVFDVGFEVAGEVGVGFSEDGKQNSQLLSRLLPFRRIRLVAIGGFKFFRAVEGEIDTVRFTVFEEIGASFAFGLFGEAIVIERCLVPPEDVNAERIVGGILAFGTKDGREEKADTE